MRQRALAIREAVYGPERPGVASTLTNLGIVHSQLGELEEARVTLQRALAIKDAVECSRQSGAQRSPRPAAAIADSACTLMFGYFVALEHSHRTADGRI